MINLANKKSNVKQSLLDNQQNTMVALYEKADQNERAAIIRQIDGFLPVLSDDEKSFWLKFRQQLERIGEGSQTFNLTVWYQTKRGAK